MHPRLHTFSPSQPYGHAYSHLCMHCMQSFSELCLRIACIVGFLMHTMHTSRMGWQSAVTAERGGDPNLDKRAMRRDGVHTCLKTRTERSLIACKSRTVEDRRTDSIKKKQKRNSLSLLFMCSYSLVCTLYAVCMHPRLHTFSPSQPYGHAYSHLCMHCMQSIPELCSRIECIVGFLMHTMHTTSDRPSGRRSRRIAYTPAGTHDDRRLRMGRDGGRQPVRRAVKA